MFEKLSQAAEQMATKVSRRQFLGRLGGGALALATAVGGLLALPDAAEAARPACGPGSVRACQGRWNGAGCRMGRYSGRCVAAPLCYCRIRERPGR